MLNFFKIIVIKFLKCSTQYLSLNETLKISVSLFNIQSKISWTFDWNIYSFSRSCQTLHCWWFWLFYWLLCLSFQLRKNMFVLREISLWELKKRECFLTVEFYFHTWLLLLRSFLMLRCRWFLMFSYFSLTSSDFKNLTEWWLSSQLCFCDICDQCVLFSSSFSLLTFYSDFNSRQLACAESVFEFY